MASRQKLWSKKFLLILIFLILEVPVFVMANEQKTILHGESSNLQPPVANSTGKKVSTVEENSYFKEIALQVEYGTQVNRIHKWTEELQLQIIGEISDEDKNVLDNTIQTLNQLSGNLKLSYAQKNEQANVQVYFVPHAEFVKYTSIQESVIMSNWGLGAVWWNEQGEVYQAQVLIATDLPNPKERAHLIREELTQSLGLLNDSWKEPESIFYQGWGIQDYTELDKKLVQILYQDRIRPNMQEDELDWVLARPNPSILSFIAIPETG